MTKTRKTSARIASVVLIIAMLLSTMCIAGTASVSAAETDRVKLHSATPFFVKNGMTTYEAYIQTKDNASDQKVYVHYNYMDGQEWLDQEAEFFKTLDDGTKIWKASFNSFNARYCIKYVADGVTYWDNNNGNDYFAGNAIGSAPVISERMMYQYPYMGYTVMALLQNYGYHKNVFVRYTTDDWKTYNDVPMFYYVSNGNGTETWCASLPMYRDQFTSKDFHYAICYQVNGQEYWANNFGADYDCHHHIYQ